MRILSPFTAPPGQYPTQIWTATSSSFPVADDELAAALAMHLQPDLEPSTDVPQGLSINLNTPPPTEPSLSATFGAESPFRLSPRSRLPDSNFNGVNSRLRQDASDSDEAVADAVRGMFKLWQSLKKVNGGGTDDDQEAFLALVADSISDL